MTSKETTSVPKKNTSSVMTPVFRVSFPNVFKPRANFEGQKPAYSVQMLFEKDADLKVLRQAVVDAATAKWGDKSKWPKFKYPVFKDGNEKNLDNYKDKIVVEARTIQKPGLIDQKRQDIIDASEFYAGCYARATVTCYAYSHMGNNGVSFGLQNIQKVKDGEAFSGKRNAKDEFETIEDLDGEAETEEFEPSANLNDF